MRAQFGKAFIYAGAALAAGLFMALASEGARAAGSGGGMGGAMGGASTPTPSRTDPEQLYREGVEALQARDYRTAIAKFRQVLRAAPRHGPTNYLYGLALIGNGDARDARRPLERAVAGDGAVPDARLQLALIYLNEGDRERAIAQQTALAEELAQCREACDASRRGQLQSAHEALTRALNGGEAPAADPSSTSWLVPGEPQGRAAYAAAVGLINAERFAEALPALDRAAAAIGPHPDILNYMGFANRKLGRHERALDFYRQALALDPNHRGANEYLGELYLEMGRLSDARRQLARLDALCPFGCAEREELARWILASN